MNVPFSAPRRNWPSLLLNVAVLVVVLAMAAATFVLSYSGVHAIVLQAGVSPRLARIYPGLFDAVFLIACVAAVMLRDARWWALLYAWLVIILTVLVVGAADVVYAMNITLRHRTIEGVVAAAPWVLLLLGFSLMLTMLRQPRVQQAQATASAEPWHTWPPAWRNCPRPHRSRNRTPYRSASGYRRTSRNLTTMDQKTSMYRKTSRRRTTRTCRSTRTCRRTKTLPRTNRPPGRAGRRAGGTPSPTPRTHPSRRRRMPGPMPGPLARTWTPPVTLVQLSPCEEEPVMAAAAANGEGVPAHAASREATAPTTPCRTTWAAARTADTTSRTACPPCLARSSMTTRRRSLQRRSRRCRGSTASVPPRCRQKAMTRRTDRKLSRTRR